VILNPYDEPPEGTPDWVEQETMPVGDIGPPIPYADYVTLCQILGTTPVPSDVFDADLAEEASMSEAQFSDPEEARDEAGRGAVEGGGTQQR
jgi:hypothetical protein